MLDIERLSVAYRGAPTLKEVSLRVPDGSVVALLGSNGAGKSTLLRAVSGTLPLHKGRITGGRICWDGRDIVGRDSAAIVRSGLVQVPEGRKIFTRMTVGENLRAGAVTAARGTVEPAVRRVEELFPILGERRQQRAGLLSGGEQQMLAIGRALMTTPRLLLLDEPSLGLAPLIISQIAQVVREINRQGTSVLLVEQNVAVALELASHAYVLDVGRLTLSGTSAELQASDEVRRLYLGEAAVDLGEVGCGAGAEPERHLSRWARA
ncbi:ABC transporter ATP-binding protein [Blastococcus sp. SYSU DS0533]